jgi:hypothetical protein
MPLPACTIYTNSSWALAQPETGAWWISGGPKAVTCFPALTFNNGQKVLIPSVQGDFMVYRPSIETFILSTSIGIVLDTNTDIYLGLGQRGGSGSSQMSWTMIVNVNPAYPGTLSYIQLTNPTNNLDNVITYPTGGAYWLDKSDPYPGEVTQVLSYSSTNAVIEHFDTPSITRTCVSVIEKQDGFTTYTQFQPAGGIPITIGSVNWFWHGKATPDANGVWNLDITNYTVLPDFDDDSFPKWPNTYNP